MPWLFQSDDYLQPVEAEIFDTCAEETLQPVDICDSDIRDLCQIYMEENSLSFGFEVDERFDIYIKLKDLFVNDLNDII